VLVRQIAWKVVLWLALNLSDARTVLSASQEHLFVELLRLLQSRGLLLTWRTKQQRHELFVQFVRKQPVTKCRSVSVPFGDYQCIAIRHRIETRREVDDFESRSSRQANDFRTLGRFRTIEI